MWFLLALIAALFFGTGQVVVRKGQTHLPPLIDNFLATIIVNSIVAPLMIFKGVRADLFLSTLPFALIVAFLYVTYYYVISKGQLSITATLLASFPIVTTMLSFLVLNERPTIIQLGAIALVVTGATILTFSSQPNRYKNRVFLISGVIWGIFGAIMMGMADFTSKLGIMQSDASTFTFLMSLSYIPAVLCLVFFRGRELPRLKMRSSGFLSSIIGVALIELGLIPYNMAFEVGPASLVSTIGACQVLIMVILAVKFLKDKLRPFQYLGIFSTLTGIIILGLFR